MRVSRATFLKAFGTAIVGAGVDARTLVASAAGLSNVPELPRAGGRFTVLDAEAAHFRPHLNTSFSVHSAGGASARLVLVEVAERPITRDVEQFSLIFHAPAATTLPQGTHAVHHHVLGDFDLFIVPIGAPNGRRTVYQACFSRHLSPDETRCAQAAASIRRRT
jgi:hypothetical protein